jgi:hypothetical protein
MEFIYLKKKKKKTHGHDGIRMQMSKCTDTFHFAMPDATLHIRDMGAQHFPSHSA